MTRASTTTSTGHRAAISDPLWTTTQITLSSSGRRFVGSGGGAGADADPSRLVFGATAFGVTYTGPATSGTAGAYLAHHARSAAVAPRGRRTARAASTPLAGALTQSVRPSYGPL